MSRQNPDIANAPVFGVYVMPGFFYGRQKTRRSWNIQETPPFLWHNISQNLIWQLFFILLQMVQSQDSILSVS